MGDPSCIQPGRHRRCKNFLQSKLFLLGTCILLLVVVASIVATSARLKRTDNVSPTPNEPVGGANNDGLGGTITPGTSPPPQPSPTPSEEVTPNSILPTLRPSPRPSETPTSAPTPSPTSAPTPAPTPAPTRSERDLVIEFLAEAVVSDVTALISPGTPENEAMDWLLDVDDLDLSIKEPDRLLQRFVVSLLYFATGGGITSTHGWRECSSVPDPIQSNETTNEINCFFQGGIFICASPEDFVNCTYTDPLTGNAVSSKRFLSPVHECDWFGIACDTNQKVTEIILDDNILNGTVPAELIGLSELRVISMSDNRLQGTLPEEWGGLQNLEILRMSNNQLTGCVSNKFYRNNSLQEIDFQMNWLSGTLSSEIGQWPDSLRIINLRQNHFTGSIPTEIGLLSGVSELYLQRNDFNGTIPTEIGNMESLQRLFVSEGSVTGRIPSELGRVSGLASISLLGNMLSGSIPTELYGLSRLQVFRMARNALTGTLSTRIENWVDMQRLSLHHNALSGRIPIQIRFLSNLDSLALYYNHLTGRIPSRLCHVASTIDVDCLSGAVYCTCCTRCCDNTQRLCEDN